MDWPADKIERRAVAALVPAARNARTHSGDQISQIAASIREWGWTTAVLLDEANGIIAGHGRVLAAKNLGISEIPCMVARGWSDAQKRAYMLADNKLPMNAGWDNDLLKIELGDLRSLDFNLELTGFSLDEIGALTADKNSGLTDPDDAPDAPSDPVSRLGDIWVLGKHRLACGDSTDADCVKRVLNGVNAALCFTSPPYLDAREYKGGDLSVTNLSKFFAPISGRCAIVAVNLGIVRRSRVISRYWDEYIKSAETSGFPLLAWNVWDKGEAGSVAAQNAMFAQVHEWVFVFGSYRKLTPTRNNKSAGLVADHTSHRQTDGSVRTLSIEFPLKRQGI